MHVMVAADCPEEGCHPGGLAAGRLRHRGAQRQARGRARPLPQGGQAARGPQRQGEIWGLVLLKIFSVQFDAILPKLQGANFNDA